MKNTENVYSYNRWSSDAQSKGDSERRQQENAERWCASKGLKMADEAFTDRGVSAWKGGNQKRELGRLLNVVKPGDTLLVEDVDRLSRQGWKPASDFLEKLLSKGCRVVTLQNGAEITEETFRTNPGVFLPLIMQAHLAGAENDKKSVRLKASWATRIAAVKTGKALNQNLPGWLKWNKESKLITVNNERVATVRRMFKLYLEGRGLVDVSRQLNAEGAVRVSRKAKLGGAAIARQHGTSYLHRVLTNRAVLGECQGQPGLWPAIVSEKDFYAVAARLKAGQRQTVSTKSAADNLFVGITCCAKCGGPLHRHSQKANGTTYHYLVCGDSLRGYAKCGLSSVKYADLEKSFLSLLSEADLVSKLMGDKPEASNVDALRGKLIACEQQAEKLLRLIEGEDAPPKRLLERLKEIEAEETTLREQVQTEDAKTKSATPPAAAYARFRADFAGNMQKPEQRVRAKEVLRSIVQKISVKLGKTPELVTQYEVSFHGAKQPVSVKVDRRGNWSFSPAPFHAMGNKLPRTATNVIA